MFIFLVNLNLKSILQECHLSTGETTYWLCGESLHQLLHGPDCFTASTPFMPTKQTRIFRRFDVAIVKRARQIIFK